jgi:hypothetical protein
VWRQRDAVSAAVCELMQGLFLLKKQVVIAVCRQNLWTKYPMGANATAGRGVYNEKCTKIV